MFSCLLTVKMDAKSARSRTQMVWSLEDELMEKNDNSRKQLFYLCSDFFFFFSKIQRSVGVVQQLLSHLGQDDLDCL